MISKFLNMKAWLLFLLSFGTFFGIHILLFVSIMLEATYGIMLQFFVVLFIIFLTMTSVLVFTISLWLWAVTVELKKRISKEINVTTKFFKPMFFLMLFLLISIFGFVFLNIFMSIKLQSKFSVLFTLVMIIIHIIPFYLVYSAAKVFKTLELNRNVSFSDFAGDFFLILFFPIGIWIIQPKINQLVK